MLQLATSLYEEDQPAEALIAAGALAGAEFTEHGALQPDGTRTAEPSPTLGVKHETAVPLRPVTFCTPTTAVAPLSEAFPKVTSWY